MNLWVHKLKSQPPPDQNYLEIYTEQEPVEEPAEEVHSGAHCKYCTETITLPHWKVLFCNWMADAQDMSGVEAGVDRIVDQIVDPKEMEAKVIRSSRILSNFDL